ncbi:MAG: hypothetical protein ACXW3X_15225 [Rhodoplanes sp.]
MRHVAGPQPEARQEQDDRTITPARNAFAIACRDQPVHLLRRQISRQVGKPPMGIARNDIGETCSAAAFDSKIPQEGAQAGCQLLDGSIAAMARAVQEKAANSGRFPPFWIVPECRHQVGGVAGVELDGGIGRPAVLTQPHFEVSHQARLGMPQCGSGGPANADFDKVLAKEPGAENGVVVATPSHGARTSTNAQVLAEHRQINVARHCPLPSHDMAEVRCRPQISHGRSGAIALPLERGCETVKVWSAWPASQMPQHLRC